MATLDFSRLADIERIAGDKLDQVVRGTLLDLSRRVIMRTPVGDPSGWQNPPPPGYVGGTARGNWQVSYGSPEPGVLARTDQSGQTTIADVAQQTELAGGNVWYLTNNLPYIQRLEFEGWSDQSPQGMVRISLSELDRSIDAQIAQLPR